MSTSTDNAELVNKVQNKLRSMSGEPAIELDSIGEQTESEPETEEESSEPTDSTDDESVESEGGDESEPAGESGVEEEASEEAASESDDDPTLPDAHIRSLKAYEWTEDEIKEALDNDPDGFSKIAEKVHNTRVKESQKWAELGRQRKQDSQPEQSQPQQSQSPNQQTQSATPNNGLTPIDVEALKKEYGDDELVERLAGPVNQAIQQVNQMLPVLEQSQQYTQQAQQSQLEQMVDSFFQSDTMKPYQDLYGPSFQSADDTQYEQRQKVLETADALVVGAQAQGRDLNFREAMQLAHDLASGDFKSQQARAELKSKVQKRNKGKTQRPSKSATSTAANNTTPKKPASEDELVARTQERLQKAGLG